MKQMKTKKKYTDSTPHWTKAEQITARMEGPLSTGDIHVAL